MIKKSTMSDIAAACGVSQATVSLVLNNAPGTRISPATREAVLSAAARMGYRTQARRIDRRPLIAMLINEVTSSPHVAGLIDGAAEAANELGYLLSVMPTDADEEAEQAALSHLATLPAAGVIYARLITQQVTLAPQLAEWPTVLLNCYTIDKPLPSVVPGDLSAVMKATLSLIDAGHTRIAYIGGEDAIEASRERIKGYRRALTMRDIPVDNHLIIKGRWTIQGGYAAFKRLQALDDRPTAICCFCDRIAMGVYEAAKEAGLSIPRDLSVIGFDNESYSGDMLPPLTTMQLPHADMARYAVEKLAEMIAAPRMRHDNHKVKLECEMIVRQSVAPIDAV
ncbi:substrate-binding domain-containing protein [Rhizobium leguminosarum]|uniref:LacI family DNA-binding transcriptional regulator n=2 Tax=Rhizobium TaxID=379 RepID=UPI001C90D630|nr:LacI family DNA-binding transcriptional regulator [Rhizobium laguerreae]MBY3037078.1 substrate-binding domain-containing protein [Rhizobium laguerreae]MBY3333059.1 substrate-binding domain-containing protein [Rhizobium laguerreae]MBY5612809.1 substrate-binding domain-containing protein [Rhizobium leguminosarum]MBY5659560.1 substrate-binding domain-containing protein [Rhizobium leguminosarum]